MDTSSNNEGSLIMPRELSGPIPRNTRITSGGIQTMVVSTMLIAFQILLMLWFGFKSSQEIKIRNELRSGGREVSGEVVDTRKSQVYYTFSVNGSVLSGKAQMPFALSPALHHFDLLPIRYLPGTPAINHPAAWEWSAWMNWQGFLFPLLLLAIAVFLLWDLRGRRQLIAEGKPALATITGCTRGRHGVRATFDFRTEQGTTISAVGGVGSLLEAGAQVWVVYLPQDPRRNVTYPSPSYRVVE